MSSHAGDVDNLRSAADDVLYLMQECGAVGSVIAGQGKHGLGLFTTHGVSKGEVSHCCRLVRVPHTACSMIL